MKTFSTDITYENDGGALMLETYSEATLDTCFFDGNKAADNGGAIYIKIRSKIMLKDSTLKLNKAKNSGGSLLISHSQAIIESCTFSNDSAILGYGGAISLENVANVTVQESSFDSCKASYGGSVSVKSESILKLEYSNLADSFAINAGGDLFVFQNSFVTGQNTTITGGKSTSGGGFYVEESSEIDLNIFNFLGNSVNKSGGAIFCKNGQVTLEEGTLLHNYAKEEGGAIFGDNCHIVFDYIKIVNNTTSRNGGGMYCKASVVEIHNSEAVNNSARYSGNFGVIKMNSKFRSNYLHLHKAQGNCFVILSSSEAELKHTYLPNWEYYCTFVAEINSQILLDSVYYTDLTTRIPILSGNNQNSICTDYTSNAKGIFKG